MKKLLGPFCLTLIIFIGSAGVSKGAEPIKGYCLSGTKHSHSPIADKCSASYEKGDYETALREFQPLAEQGNISAQFNLGQMYRRRQGVPQDDKTAVKWYRLAAEQGDANAQSNLGAMYTNGKGVLQDYVRALMWYNIASISGESENASKNRDIVEKRMTTSRIEDAQRLARECVRKKYKGC